MRTRPWGVRAGRDWNDEHGELARRSARLCRGLGGRPACRLLPSPPPKERMCQNECFDSVPRRPCRRPRRPGRVWGTARRSRAALPPRTVTTANFPWQTRGRDSDQRGQRVDGAGAARRDAAG